MNTEDIWKRASDIQRKRASDIQKPHLYLRYGRKKLASESYVQKTSQER